MELCPLCGAELGGPYQMQGTKDVRYFEIIYVSCTDFYCSFVEWVDASVCLQSEVSENIGSNAGGANERL